MGARSRVAVVVVSMAVAVAVLGMDLPGVPVSSAGAQEQPASAPDCSSNSDDTSIGSDMRCIGLKDLSTRNRLLSKCFDAKAFREGAVYEDRAPRGGGRSSVMLDVFSRRVLAGRRQCRAAG